MVILYLGTLAIMDTFSINSVHSSHLINPGHNILRVFYTRITYLLDNFINGNGKSQNHIGGSNYKNPKGSNWRNPNFNHSWLGPGKTPFFKNKSGPSPFSLSELPKWGFSPNCFSLHKYPNYRGLYPLRESTTGPGNKTYEAPLLGARATPYIHPLKNPLFGGEKNSFLNKGGKFFFTPEREVFISSLKKALKGGALLL